MIVLAGDEARQLRHSYIGSEHILLGLLGEADGLAARVLSSLGVSLELVRAHVIRIVAAGEEPVPARIPFTPRAQRGLELAFREALSLGHNYIGTEHLLLGLVREADGVAVRILRELGAESGSVRAAMIELVSPPPAVAGRAGAHRSEYADPGVLPIDAAWLDEIGGFLPGLTAEIREALQREPDAGDLLLALVCATDTGGRALHDLGVNLDELTRLIETNRAAGFLSAEDRIEEVRQRKESAIEAGQHEAAGRLREEERALTRSNRERRNNLLNEIRRRLGIPELTADR